MNGYPICLLGDISPLDRGYLHAKISLQSLSARDFLNARQLTPATASAVLPPCYLGSLEMKLIYSSDHSREWNCLLGNISEDYMTKTAYSLTFACKYSLFRSFIRGVLI